MERASGKKLKSIDGEGKLFFKSKYRKRFTNNRYKKD